MWHTVPCMVRYPDAYIASILVIECQKQRNRGDKQTRMSCNDEARPCMQEEAQSHQGKMPHQQGVCAPIVYRRNKSAGRTAIPAGEEQGPMQGFPTEHPSPPDFLGSDVGLFRFDGRCEVTAVGQLASFLDFLVQVAESLVVQVMLVEVDDYPADGQPAQND